MKHEEYYKNIAKSGTVKTCVDKEKTQVEDFVDISFEPDWGRIWTPSEAENQLNGFQFKGPGWYKEGDATVIALPVRRIKKEFWAQRFSDDEKFMFLIYNGRSPSDIFNLFTQAPYRSDT